ncbi:hypothetical protein [Flavobacterium sp. MMS24-S5]|uniref:hypothetical protein n=1 Tax=Flavobacterium sp. MMS24-S5 TaxID=3416605 RepID=UPI003D0640DE
MKKITILAALSLLSCNGQQEKKEIGLQKIQMETKKNSSMEILNLTDFKFKTNINDVLKGIGLTLDDNVLNEYNISGDYEEFKFAPQQISLFGKNIDAKKNEISFFYTKKDKLIWCYEINILNNDDALKIIKGFENKYSPKPAFSKISLSTKEHPLFLDENGEFKKDKMEERILVWEYDKEKITFFVIYKVNYDKNPIDGTLQIIAIDKDSTKYKDWVSFRSLDLYYKN